MRAQALLFLYVSRLRKHLGQELLAFFGIAVGVALVFAVLVANQSVSGSVDELVRGIVGRASLELHARDSSGLDQRIYGRVKRVSGVRSAAPALARHVAIEGPDGRRSVTLFGGDKRVQRLGGTLTRRIGLVGVPSVSLPESVARPIGLHPGRELTIISGGRKYVARVGALLSSADIGDLAQSPIAIAPLSYTQRLTGMRGRVSHVLVEPRPNETENVRDSLERIGGGKLDVRSSDSESALVREAAKANHQSTILFSAISAGIGLLFAYNAMLLTLPARRRMCAEMRLLGFGRRQVLASLLFETAVLATVGVAAGLLLGDVLSRVLFGEPPRYLASAFAIGNQRIVTPAIVATAAGLGVVATFSAAARPLRELYLVRPMDATHRMSLTEGERLTGGWPKRLFWAGLATLVGLSVLASAAPSAGLLAATLYSLVAVALLPFLLNGAVRIVGSLSVTGRRRRIVWIATQELAATPTRAAALAATAAVAVFGITTVEGARQDLIRGADAFAAELGGAGAIHIVAGGEENYLALEPFAAHSAIRRIRRMDIVRSVHVHRGELLDVGRRRLALFGRPPGQRQLAMASVLSEGSLPVVSKRLRAGGWAVVSTRVARERQLSLGERFELPTPAGRKSFRLAAKTTNYFWPPGAVVLGTHDYQRFWNGRDASELMVDLRTGVDPERAKRAVLSALGRESGLRVLTGDERRDEFGATARQSLATLGQIGGLVLICAALAVAAAMSAAVWQRRQRLAALKTIGFQQGHLWRLILVETMLLLAIGGSIGAAIGLYAQGIASRWIELTSGSSVAHAPAFVLAAGTLAVLIVLATAIAALPGRLASRIPSRAAFSE